MFLAKNLKAKSLSNLFGWICSWKIIYVKFYLRKIISWQLKGSNRNNNWKLHNQLCTNWSRIQWREGPLFWLAIEFEIWQSCWINIFTFRISSELTPLNCFRSEKSVYEVKKWNIAATIWICYNLQIQKRVVSAETIWGNTVTNCRIRQVLERQLSPI